MQEDNINEEVEEVLEEESDNDLTREKFFEVLEHVSDVEEDDE